MEQTSDPGLYRRLCEPHETVEAANSEMREFVEAVSELRVKHRIPDLVIICAIHAMRDGVEIEAQVSHRLGHYMAHEEMVARELGRIQGDRQQAIAQVLREESLRTPR